MSLSSRRIGTILNILFAINWLFTTLTFVNTRKSGGLLTGNWEIISYLVPLLTLACSGIYIFINYYQIKKLLREYQVKAYKYLKVITSLAIITILGNLLILLAKSNNHLNLGFALALGISITCGLITIILDVNFFIKLLKWSDLSVASSNPEILDLDNTNEK